MAFNDEENRPHHINVWRDSLNQLNESNDETEIELCKEYLTMLKNESWFTDAITQTDLDDINSVL